MFIYSESPLLRFVDFIWFSEFCFNYICSNILFFPPLVLAWLPFLLPEGIILDSLKSSLPSSFLFTLLSSFFPGLFCVDFYCHKLSQKCFSCIPVFAWCVSIYTCDKIFFFPFNLFFDTLIFQDCVYFQIFVIFPVFFPCYLFLVTSHCDWKTCFIWLKSWFWFVVEHNLTGVRLMGIWKECVCYFC